VGEHVSDGNVLELLQRFLKQGVMESGKGWKPTEQGPPQGAVISPLRANLYLNSLDHQMAGQGWEWVRYADDFVIMCASQQGGFDFLGNHFERGSRWPRPKSLHKVRAAGQVDPTAIANDPAPAAQRERPSAGNGSSTLAQRLPRGARVILVAIARTKASRSYTGH
jgi:hypothetical protein